MLEQNSTENDLLAAIAGEMTQGRMKPLEAERLINALTRLRTNTPTGIKVD